MLRDFRAVARYAGREAIVEKGRLTALPPGTALNPATLSAVLATSIVRVDAAGIPAFLSPGPTLKLRPLGHKPAGFLDDMMP